ncbi:MAG TPA: SRPBCC family protein [Actinophytocola sp.]|uniref:SRPBCC family protein n=1 Tax=Actinophytocola sp. TaxID=1872138 RepID=UPI002DBD4F50|nr:SRPBCC family protein [Actinophytocola sp.]HEU5471481.1 SRPBCC family protein [Actinophytocola sp.]
MRVMEIVREARIEAPAEKVWAVVSDPARAGDWFAFAERVEVREGAGVGQLRTQHGRWGNKPAEVDQEVIAYEPNRLLAWRHLAERLNGKPAPRFAASTEFRIELAPDGTATTVRLRSRQEPAGPVRGAIMRLFGTKDVARAMERSLDRLTTVFS